MTATPKTATPSMEIRKRVALVAHDNKKEDLLDWARFNQGTLSRHELLGTGTTGKLIHSRLGLEVTRLLSGPMGGDQQLGAMIAEGKLDGQDIVAAAQEERFSRVKFDHQTGSLYDYLDKGRPDGAGKAEAESRITEYDSLAESMKREYVKHIARLRRERPELVEQWVSEHFSRLAKEHLSCGEAGIDLDAQRLGAQAQIARDIGQRADIIAMVVHERRHEHVGQPHGA